jgi:hypothetical protein
MLDVVLERFSPDEARTLVRYGPRGKWSKTIDVPKYWALCATGDFNGDLEYAALHAGESCSLVNDVKPAAQIVRDLMDEAYRVAAQFRDAH